MPVTQTLNRCRACGATSYHRVIQRDAHGRMSASCLYKCSGCELVFETPTQWRGTPGLDFTRVGSAATGESAASRTGTL